MDTNNNNDLKQCTCTGERSCGKTQKVVNDLLKRISNLEFDVEDKQREIERLNNIINELEKWLNEWKNWIDRPDEFEDGIISCINDTLDKIKELKGSESNE